MTIESRLENCHSLSSLLLIMPKHLWQTCPFCIRNVFSMSLFHHNICEVFFSLLLSFYFLRCSNKSNAITLFLFSAAMAMHNKINNSICTLMSNLDTTKKSEGLYILLCFRSLSCVL